MEFSHNRPLPPVAYATVLKAPHVLQQTQLNQLAFAALPFYQQSFIPFHPPHHPQQLPHQLQPYTTSTHHFPSSPFPQRIGTPRSMPPFHMRPNPGAPIFQPMLYPPNLPPHHPKGSHNGGTLALPMPMQPPQPTSSYTHQTAPQDGARQWHADVYAPTFIPQAYLVCAFDTLHSDIHLNLTGS